MDNNNSYPEFATGYMDRAVYDLPGIITQAKKELKNIEFDTMVGTGFSGSVVIPALAMAMKKNWLLVRKESDDSHHGGGRLVGNLGADGTRWLFVDDFVSSGRTLHRVFGKVQDAASLHDKEVEWVGAWQYCWADPSGFRAPSTYDYVFENAKEWKW